MKKKILLGAVTCVGTMLVYAGSEQTVSADVCEIPAFAQPDQGSTVTPADARPPMPVTSGLASASTSSTEGVMWTDSEDISSGPAVSEPQDDSANLTDFFGEQSAGESAPRVVKPPLPAWKKYLMRFGLQCAMMTEYMAKLSVAAYVRVKEWVVGDGK